MPPNRHPGLRKERRVSTPAINSIISIQGTVRAVHCQPSDCQTGDSLQQCNCRFALENDDGRFSVQAYLTPDMCEQMSSRRVQVVGSLQSAFFRRCHQDHHLIKAMTVIILNPGSDNFP